MDSEKKVFKIGQPTFKFLHFDENYDYRYIMPQPRTFKIDKITKCYIFWCELDTNCWNNNHKIFKKKKYFCDVRNCEYFEDNTGCCIYAEGTYI